MDSKMREQLDNHITGVYRETRPKAARLNEYVPGPYMAENGAIKFLHRGKWRKFASVDSKLFTPDGIVGCAKSIVRACNAHDDMVAALEWLLQFDPDCDGGSPDYKELRHICDTARTALAKAKGEA